MSQPSEHHPSLEADRERFCASELSGEETDTLFAALAAETVDKAPSPRDHLRDASTPMRLAIGIAMVAALSGLALSWLTPRGDLPSLFSGHTLASFAVVLFCGGTALWLSIQSFSSPISARTRQVALAAGLGVPVLIAALPSWWPGMAIPPEMGWAPTLHCTTWGSATAVVVTLATLLLQRSDRPSAWRLASAAGVGGCVGFVVTTLHCPANAWAHLVFTHGSLGIVVAACTLAVARVLTPAQA